jgi:two-component system, chemotaxis family, protein-glutamate methylesterase/glutaminase
MAMEVRVLVVDDSAYMRHTITRLLEADPEITVVGAARDGVQALELVESLRPDVLTLDVEMPRLDGLSTLRRLMATNPLPVVMLSSTTGDGSRTTIAALESVAVDFVLKPSGAISLNIHQVAEELVAKVKAAARVHPGRISATRTGGQRVASQRSEQKPVVEAASWPAQSIAVTPAASARGGSVRRVVVIGSSTGGPRALYEVVPSLPADLGAAVVIVQHMPAGFTKSLADRLNTLSQLTVREAVAGDHLENGTALVAPGGRHLLVGRDGEARLSDSPPVHGVRPAIDVTIDSVVRAYGGACIGVILTGMGSDGALSCRGVRQAGGLVIAEHESTCVIYGMPRSVIEAGQADRVSPLPQVAGEIVRALSEQQIIAPGSAAYRSPLPVRSPIRQLGGD